MAEEPSSYERRSLNGDDVLFRSVLPQAPQKNRIRTQVLLFLATVYTTTAAGMQNALSMQMVLSPETFDPNFDFVSALWDPAYLVLGLPFSLTLLTILGVHEMGHYVASRMWQVRATLPYFIPVPTFIGTLGAVIRLQSRIPNRRALIDIGASGPLAGFVVAVVALGVGLHFSILVPVAEISEGSIYFGDSILTAWMGNLIIGDLPEGYDVYIHPIGFAGWLGLFVTVLNLLPMGQFDGGHIVYAIFGRLHSLITKGTLVALGLFCVLGPPYDWLNSGEMFSTWIQGRWIGWLLWIFLGVVFGRRHPPPADPYLELDPPRRWVGYATLAIFVLCFIPRPIYF